MFAGVVDTVLAKTVATNYYKALIYQHNELKKVSVENIEFNLVHCEKSSQSVVLKSTSIPCFYIFNVNANDGFVVVSAESSTVPVLGYSLTGQYNETAEKPEALKELLNNYKNQIFEVKSNNIKTSETVKKMWNELGCSDALKNTNVSSSVSPLLSTTWNQGCYYNEQCPYDESGYCNHKQVGCVGVAVAQIMKYWEYPESNNVIAGYSSSGENISEISSITYNWDNMEDKLTGSSSSEAIDAVSILLYHCAAAIETRFGTYSSSASLLNVCDAFASFFDYSSSLEYLKKKNFTEEEWTNILKGEIEHERPVLYSGGVHAFVCDGYKDDYFHFNWGWGGYCDGYFYINNLVPVDGHDYNNGQVAIIGIQAPGTEDLFLSDAQISSNTMINIKDTVSVVVTQNYSGNYFSESNLPVCCFLSADSLFDRTDILLDCNVSSSSVNKENFSDTENIKFVLPEYIEGGNYNIFIVADAENAINESDESNNKVPVEITLNIPVENTYVPDDNFEQALIDLGYDSGELNDSVPTDNISNVTSLYLNSKKISDLTGIEDFSALKILYCNNNKLTDIDLGKNKVLTKLSLWYNGLSSLDVDENSELTYLDCGYNKLLTLNIINNTKLQEFYCNNNDLTTLDVSKNKELQKLYCYNNSIEELDVSNNTGLIKIDCEGNQLISFDLSYNVLLEYLDCRNNSLSELVLKNGNNEVLTKMNATDNENLTCIEVDDPDLAVCYSGWQIDESGKYLLSCAESKSDTDLAEIKNEEEIHLYPNPSCGIVIIDNCQFAGEVNVEVIRMTGAKVLSHSYYSPGSIKLDLSNIVNGVYLVRIARKELLVIKKIVLKK